MIHGFTEPFAYYGSVVWRALRDTFRHFAREVVVGVILLVLATWIRCATLPRGQECEIGDFKAGLAAVAIYFGVVFLFHLVMAPVRLHREQAQLIDPGSAEPILVKLVAKELRDAILQDTFGYGDDFSYSAHQTSDGIELSWSVLRREGDKLPPYIPRDAKCIVQVGDERIEAEMSPAFYRASCKYPHLDFFWEAMERQWPTASLLRGEAGATPEEPEWVTKRFAWWSIDIEVTRGGNLV